MREIEFRGKRVDNGEWVYGYILVTQISGVYIIGSNMEVKKGRYEGVMYDKLWQFEVIPETVGQFTGLHDKNGKKIYKGDMCSTDLQRKYNIVVFRNGAFMYSCHDDGKDYFDIMLPTDEENNCDKYTDVIGNIHDNPELLKGESI